MSEQECLKQDIEYVQRKIEHIQEKVDRLCDMSADVRGHRTNEKVRKFEVEIDKFTKLLNQMEVVEKESDHIHECSVSTEIKPTEVVNNPKPNKDEAYLL